MNECLSCKAPLPSGATRCPRCGTPAPRTAETPGNANPFMDFGQFMETASTPPAHQTYQTLSRPLAVGASQQAQPAFPAEQVPTQSAPLYPYPQQPYALPYPAQAVPVMPVPAQTRTHRISALVIALVAVLVIAIIFGSGIIYYAAIAQPAAQHAQATVTAKTLATAQTRASATAYANTPQGIFTLATSGTPTINDSLSNPDTSLWANHSNSGAQCAFTGGAYHITIKVSNYFYYCTPITTGFSNFAFQVQMTLLSGDTAGLMFRVSGPTLKSYLFFLSGSGYYGLILTSDFSKSRTLAINRSTAIKQGFNQPNVLTVIAKGNDLYLFINRQYVTKITDSTYSEGNLGLFASAYKIFPTEAVFSNAEAWDIP